jgi:hypothetical protein
MKETERAPSQRAELIPSLPVFGGSTSGWMTASYSTKRSPDRTSTLDPACHRVPSRLDANPELSRQMDCG